MHRNDFGASRCHRSGLEHFWASKLRPPRPRLPRTVRGSLRLHPAGQPHGRPAQPVPTRLTLLAGREPKGLARQPIE
jgi:hypothetical protein